MKFLSDLDDFAPSPLFCALIRIVQHLESGIINLGSVQTLVIDEADLVLSFGYAEDVQLITSHMPKLFQVLLTIMQCCGLFIHDRAQLDTDYCRVC